MHAVTHLYLFLGLYCLSAFAGMLDKMPLSGVEKEMVREYLKLRNVCTPFDVLVACLLLCNFPVQLCDTGVVATLLALAVYRNNACNDRSMTEELQTGTS